MDSNKIDLNGQVFEQEKDGSWIYKAEESKFKKQDGTLKKKYADMPRYDLIPKYENYFVNLFNKELKEIQKELTDKIKEIIS